MQTCTVITCYQTYEELTSRTYADVYYYMWITLKLQFYKNRHNIWIASLKIIFFTTNSLSMYIEMCIPSSFNKTNEKKRKERRKNSKNQHQDLGLIKKIVCFSFFMSVQLPNTFKNWYKNIRNPT
jgi:hypothetical protein